MMDGPPDVLALGGALEGAEHLSRETMLWNADRRSPDQIINGVKDEADFRGRDQVTNDGWGQGVVETYRDTIVGNQYRMNSTPNWEVLSHLYSSRYDEVWAEEFQTIAESMFNLIGESNASWFDAQRRLTLSGLVRLGIAGFVYTGEVLATCEWIRETGRPFSTAVQLISPTRLSNPDGKMDDAKLRRGVQRDSRGKPIGYFIRVAHPTEFWYGYDTYKWTFVPTEKPWGRRQVIHIADQVQPDQTRGVSQLVAVLKDMRMTKRFHEIVLQNAVVNASYAATIESDLPREVIASAIGAGTSGDATNSFLNVIGGYLSSMEQYASQAGAIAVDGAKMPHLFPGTSLNVRTLGTPGGVGTDFEVSLLRHIAAGLGIGYEELAQDFSRTNYSSARASMIGTHKHMLAKKKFVADRLADEIYALWVEEWLAAGNLPLPRGQTRDIFYKPFGKECLVACDWIGMGRGQIDPLKETQAALLLVRANMSTREAEIAKFGGDWKRVFRQLAREKKLADELGLEFSQDVTKDGAANTQTVMQDQEAA